MKVSGNFAFNAARDLVFRALKDARCFDRSVDGVRELKEIGDHRHEAVFETTVAYLKFKLNGIGELVRVTKPCEIEAKIEGTPLGIVGRLSAISLTRLEDAGSNTKVSYTADSALSGELGSLGVCCDGGVAP
jgi:uncharacterized protein